MNLRELLITTMDQLAGSVRGLVVSHRGVTMQLCAEADGQRWSAWAVADDGEPREANGEGASFMEALDDCANEVEAIENPDPDGGVEPYEHDHVDREVE